MVADRMITGTSTAEGGLDDQGNRYWIVDVSRMPPLYRDLYERVFAGRLRSSGIGEAGFVRRTRDVIAYGGPDELVGRLRPAATAARHLTAGDHVWVARIDREWREAAVALEAATEDLWRRLLTGEPAAGALSAVLDRKVALNVLGVDSVLPAMEETRGRLAPYVAGELLDDVLSGCYMPAGGRVAFDAYEREALVLARRCAPGEVLPEDARSRFVLNGLFYRYDALDTRRREQVLVAVAHEAVAGCRRANPGRAALDAAIAEIDDRDWRRRYHRQWADQQVRDAGEPVLALFAFAGSARDYDEEKRRINMLLWRSLFALADALGLDLMAAAATASGLRDALARHEGRLPIDPVFTYQQSQEPLTSENC